MFVSFRLALATNNSGPSDCQSPPQMMGAILLWVSVQLESPGRKNTHKKENHDIICDSRFQNCNLNWSIFMQKAQGIVCYVSKLPS